MFPKYTQTDTPGGFGGESSGWGLCVGAQKIVTSEDGHQYIIFNSYLVSIHMRGITDTRLNR